jgi:hypothetical protein
MAMSFHLLVRSSLEEPRPLKFDGAVGTSKSKSEAALAADRYQRCLPFRKTESPLCSFQTWNFVSSIPDEPKRVRDAQ